MKQRSKWAILSGVVLAMLLSSLDQAIMSTAMPTIVQELHGLEHISNRTRLSKVLLSVVLLAGLLFYFRYYRIVKPRNCRLVLVSSPKL